LAAGLPRAGMPQLTTHLPAYAQLAARGALARSPCPQRQADGMIPAARGALARSPCPQRQAQSWWHADGRREGLRIAQTPPAQSGGLGVCTTSVQLDLEDWLVLGCFVEEQSGARAQRWILDCRACSWSVVCVPLCPIVWGRCTLGGSHADCGHECRVNTPPSCIKRQSSQSVSFT